MKIKLIVEGHEYRLRGVNYEYFAAVDECIYDPILKEHGVSSSFDISDAETAYWFGEDTHRSFFDKPFKKQIPKWVIDYYNERYKYAGYDGLIRPSEAKGYYPAGRALGGLFRIELESSFDADDEFLINWFCTGQLLKGCIEVWQGVPDRSPIRFEFWDCAIVDYAESFTVFNSPMLMSLRLSPAIVRNRGVLHHKSWHRTKLESTRPEFKAAVVAVGKEEGKILDAYFEDEKGESDKDSKAK